MKGLVFLAVALLCVGAAFAETVDRAPNATDNTIGNPVGYNPAFGQLIRSFRMPENAQGYFAGVATSNDGYCWSSNWSASYFQYFYVYTSTGSFVRSVSVTTRGSGFRDGEGPNHLGTGYFVTAQVDTSYRYPYSSGGNPSGSGTSFISGIRGRGIGWDGTYYYGTTGGFGTTIAVFTTTGSQVKIFPGSVHSQGLYGHAAGTGYLYCVCQSGNVMREVDSTTGSYGRSFSISATGGGVSAGQGGESQYLYYVNQASPSVMWIYDGQVGVIPAVEPASLGKIKGVFR
jgi:hypothetical protein